MKKTLKLFGLAALAAIAFSCTKKDDPFTPGTPTDQTTPAEGQTEEPAVIPATDGGVLTSFGATVDSEATKVTVDLTGGTTGIKGKTTIENGDQVRVVDSEGNSAIYVYDVDQSKFVLKDGETAVTVNTTGVYYPESEYEVVDGTVRLVLPAGIAARDDDGYDFGDAFGAINPMAGVITDGTNGYSVTLNNITSVLRVKVSADVNINSVSLDFGSDNNYAAGAKFTVNPSTSALTFVEGSASSESSVALATPAVTADVLFLLPTVEQTYGITVTANLAGNHNGGTDNFSLSNAAYTPTAGKLSTMSFYAGLFSGGTGTSGDPYKIANARDFKHISEYCADGYTPGSIGAASFLGAHYKQTKNIDFKKGDEKGDLSAYMIGGASTPFTGTYNGKSESTQYTLSNFTISGSPSGNEGVAPFKAIDGAVLQNIAISNAEITGGKFTAGLVGYAKGESKITGCSIANSTIKANINKYGVGGLIGGAYGKTGVEGCIARDMTFENAYSANMEYFGGGIVCYINGLEEYITVENCSLQGTTNLSGSQKVTGFGGIVGHTNSANITIKGCYNTSSISGQGLDNIGGIIGVQAQGTTQGCYSIGNITASGTNVGGIIGLMNGGIAKESYTKGVITGSGIVGGFVGRIEAATIVNCASGAAVLDTKKGANDGVGGFVGYSNNASTKIANCVVWGVRIKATNQTSTSGNRPRVAGFIGVANNTAIEITNCYYRGPKKYVGYGGDENNDATTVAGGNNMIACFSGYAKGKYNDCYSVQYFKGNQTPSGKYKELPEDYIKGSALFVPSTFTTSNGTTFTSGDNKIFCDVLNDAYDKNVSVNGVALSSWTAKLDQGEYYCYPSVLSEECIVK